MRRVFRSRLAFQVAGRPREEVDVVDGAGYVELAGQPDRLARLPALSLRELLGPLVEDPGKPAEHRRPLTRGCPGPTAVGLCGGVDGLVNLVGAGEPDRLDRRAVRGR